MSNIRLAVFQRLFSLFVLVIVMGIAKTIRGETGVFLIVCSRISVAFCSMLAIVVYSRVDLRKLKFFWLGFLRVMFGLSSVICTYTAYTNLPICVAASIGFTGPIINMLLARVILKEHIKPIQWWMSLVCFTGVLIQIDMESAQFNYFIIVHLFSNIFAGFAINILRFTLVKGENPKLAWIFSGIMHFVILSLTISSACLFVEGRELVKSLIFTPVREVGLDTLFLLLLIGILGVLSTYYFIHSSKLATVSVLAPIEYTRIIFAIPIDLIFFDTPLTISTFLSAVIIIIANYYAVRK